MTGQHSGTRLAKLMKAQNSDRRRTGSPTAVIVSAGTGVATINLSGVEIPGVPFMAHLTGELAADDVVSLRWVGRSPVIEGKY